MDPLEFIDVNTHIEALWKDQSDEFNWYKGVVLMVHERNPLFVECDVQYDDGVIEKFCKLNVHDYANDESEDAWRFLKPLDATIDTFETVFQRLEHLETERTKDHLFSFRDLLITSVLLATAYGAAFYHYKSAST